ncbi:MAG: hypothetical protein WCK69_00390 [Candidatus Saccharibacteria bacterium]
MKLVIVYHPLSDHATIAETYVKDFARRTQKNIKLLSLETKEGAEMATLYDVVSYPAILSLREDNQLLKLWQGLPFPVMDELMAYSY